MKSSAKLTRGKLRDCSEICFNPLVSLPDNNFVRAQLEKLEFYVAIDFFLNETARYADIVLPGSLHEEDEGTVTTAEGPRHQNQQGRRLSRRGSPRLASSFRTLPKP
jgi:predicted molibdopterin-dependent oxidoreductase YjgC